MRRFFYFMIATYLALPMVARTINICDTLIETALGEETEEYTITNNTDTTFGYSGYSCNGNLNLGDTVYLNAEPKEGYEFIHWVVNENIIPHPYGYFVLTKNTTIEAIFEPIQYEMTISHSPLYGVVSFEGIAFLEHDTIDSHIVKSNGMSHYGDIVTLTATPNDGFYLCNWLANGEIVSTANTYRFVVKSNMDIAVVFGTLSQVSCIVTKGKGSFSGEGYYIPGDTVTLTAVPDKGYNFVYWVIKDNAETIKSYDNPYLFKVPNSDVLAEAFFEEIVPGNVDETTMDVYPIKRIENGILIISYNGQKYNVQGQLLH